MAVVTACRRCGRAIAGEAALDDRQFFVHPGECPPLQVGDRVPMPEPKLDVRPAFTGAGKASFRAVRREKRI